MKNILLIAIVALGLGVNLNAQKIERVEPANWWVDMKLSNIQLLVYGDDISHLQPSIESESITLERTVKVQNPNYLFLYVSIKDNAKAGIVPIKFLDKEETIATYDFELKPRDKGSAEIAGFNPSDVMYLITPDRFADGDESNNTIEGMPDVYNRSHKFGRHGGDIKGISDNLDYISDMGFTAIWLNPVLENNMPRTSYHGYAATDFYKIDRRFGTNEEYKDFCKLASDKGIKVIMDMILNHCGSEHWFVKDPPTDDWLNFQDNFAYSSHRRNTVQDIHASEIDKKAHSDGWFDKTMPDLNQKNELMADYLTQNSIWWIEYSGIAGIRMDTYPYPDKNYMSDWTCAVMNEYPNFNIVGEEWYYNPAIVSYWQGGKVNHDGYTSCLPSLMDFPIQNALSEGLLGNEEIYGDGLTKVYETLALDFLYPDPDNLVIFPDNHDMARFYTQMNEDYDLFKMGMAYILTMRGVPQLYYGTEILMSSIEAPDDHGIIRSDFPGGWAGDEVNAFNNDGLTEKQKEAKDFLRKLLNWRKSAEVIHNGRLMQFTAEKGVYVYFRYDKNKKVMVVLNKNTNDYSLKLDRFDEMLNGYKQGRDVLSGKLYSFKESIELPNKSALILEME